MRSITWSLAALVTMAATTNLAAQVSGGGRGTGTGAGTGRGGGRGAGIGVGSMGWAGALECLQCTIHISPTGGWIEFGAEPVVRGRSADGLLLDGDVVVAIDGILITTAAGGRRISSNLSGGLPTRVTVRRDGKQVDIMMPKRITWVVGDSILWRPIDSIGGRRGRVITWQPGTKLFQPIIKRPDTAKIKVMLDSARGRAGPGILTRDSTGRYTYKFGRGSQVDTVASARGGRLSYSFDSAFRTRLKGNVQLDSGARGRVTFKTGDIRGSDNGWLGFGIECRNCTIKAIDSAGTGRTWTIASYPTVMGVAAGGPADVAGLRVGDVLHEVDGVPITTFAGAARFSKLKAGDRVRLTVDRDGKQITLTLTVARAH